MVRDMLVSENHTELVKEKDYVQPPKANGCRRLRAFDCSAF